MSLRGALLAFGALGLLCTGTSLASSPKPERVFVNAIVEQVGPVPPGSQGPAPISWANMHVKVTAEDVDPSVPPCLGCQTADTGWIEITKVDRDDPRSPSASELSGPVSWVHIDSDGRATVVSSEMSASFRFVDGGSPGNESVGPPGPGGLVPTRDSMSWNFIPARGSGGPVRGSLIGGTIRID